MLWATSMHKTIFSGKKNNKGIHHFSADELDYLIDLLKRYNTYIQDEIEISPPVCDTSSFPEWDRNLLLNFEKKPKFSASLNAWWRLFISGWYQNLTPNTRSLCLINDETTSWVDITASALQFLQLLQWTLEDTESPLNFNNSFDPYDSIKQSIVDEIPWARITREVVKKCVIWIIYPWKQGDSRILRNARNSNMSITLEGNEKRSEIIHFFSSFLLELIERIESKIDSSLHLQIWKTEANFLYAVLEEIMKQGMHTLPLHDSFLSPTSESASIKRILDNVSKNRYEKNLHFHEGL